MTKRKHHAPEFKARVAIEAIREGMTLAGLSKKSGAHATRISARKRATAANVASAFGRRGHDPDTPGTADIQKLHQKIGQLVVKRDFSAGALVRPPGTRGKKRHARITSRAFFGSVCRSRRRGPTFCKPKGASAGNPGFMAIIDKQFLETPW